MQIKFKNLARSLPDIPPWVETRGLLLSGRCEVYGFKNDNLTDFVVRSVDNTLICVVGQPDFTSILAAVTKSGESVEVLTSLENSDHTAFVLKDWQKSRAIIHRLSSPIEFDDKQKLTINFADKDALSTIPHAYAELKNELLQALSFSLVASVFIEDKPVSFCYAGSETETLWDVSINTLPEYRRKGFAEACVKFMIQVMLERGKQPVWGAEESNVASLKLAQKVGFVPVDEVILFRKSLS